MLFLCGCIHSTSLPPNARTQEHKRSKVFEWQQIKDILERNMLNAIGQRTPPVIFSEKILFHFSFQPPIQFIKFMYTLLFLLYPIQSPIYISLTELHLFNNDFKVLYFFSSANQHLFPFFLHRTNQKKITKGSPSSFFYQPSYSPFPVSERGVAMIFSPSGPVTSMARERPSSCSPTSNSTVCPSTNIRKPSP